MRRCLLLMGLFPATVAAQTIAWSNPTGGSMLDAANWIGGVVPGPGDVASLATRPDVTGFITLELPSGLTVDAFEASHFAPNTLDGAGVLTLGLGGFEFTDAITESPGIALNTFFVRSRLGGSNGLRKTGPGFLALEANNTYTGATVIGTGGGITIDADARLGPASNNLRFAGGTLRVSLPLTSSRPIQIDIGGARFDAFADFTLSGPVSGVGDVTISRGAAATIATTAFYSGATRVIDNSTLKLTGTANSSSQLDVAGTLELGLPGSSVGASRIGDFAPVALRGATLRQIAATSSVNELVGAVSLRSGTNRIEVGSTPGAVTQLTIASLVRSDRSTLQVIGRDLGIPAANRASITISNTAGIASVGAGGPTSAAVVPWMFGNASATPTTASGVVEAGLVTLSGTIVRVLAPSEYATTFATSGQNVRVTDANITLFAPATVNALVIRDSASSSIPTGIEGSTLTVSSGAIVAVSDSAGDALYINSALAFGGAEGVVHTAAAVVGHSHLTVRGAISGSAGLTKSGAGTLRLESTSSTFTGPVTVSGGQLVVVGSVSMSQPGPLGTSVDPLILNAGAGTDFVALRLSTPLSTFDRPVIVRQAFDTGDNALLGTAGGFGSSLTGSIQLEGGFLALDGDVEPEALTLSGIIAGQGGLTEPRVNSPPSQRLRLTGQNTYSGGTIIRSGTWLVSSDAALGTGPIFFEGPGRIEALGQTVTLANAVVLRDVPTLASAALLRLTGAVDLGSVQRTLNIVDAVELAGVVSRGGIAKVGAGTLVLSGDNTYNGQTLVSAGRLQVASGGALGVASGTREQQATLLGGHAVVELVGSISTPEAFYFGAPGQPVTQTIATGNLRSLSGDNVIANVVGLDAVGTIGVDAGSTLTITGDLLDRTTDATGGLRKVGSGPLTVNRLRLPVLEIQAGLVRLAPGEGTSRLSSIAIVSGAGFDLGGHEVLLDYVLTSPLTNVLAMIIDGRVATGTAGQLIGYAEASAIFDTFPANYEGQVVDLTTLVVASTLAGDLNLDRSVDFADLLVLAQNYDTTGRFWWQGDVDYDGAVGFSDLLGLAQNYEAQAIVSDWASARALVPEPGTAAALAAAMAMWVRRPWRQRRFADRQANGLAAVGMKMR
jgi:autotransporter-associated beta strand protein